MVTPRFIRYADVVEKVRISSAALEAIRAHAQTEPEREACGLLFGAPDHVSAVRPAANVAESPARRFEIDGSALFAAIRAERAGGPKLVGYYHSHPSGLAEPSATDREMAARDGRLWVIIAGAATTGWRSTARGFEQVEVIIEPLLLDSVSATRPS
jgi:proteasome lid subunit RPN8/RPN11